MAQSQCLSSSASLLLPRPCSLKATRAQRAKQPFVAAPKRASTLAVRATAEETATSSSSAASVSDSFIPVIRPEELPKGSRKEVRVAGKGVLLFWYRNQIYAIEARSPAEGAYSEGFKDAKFTQDYCIECPSTGTLFSLKDGSIVSWYPNNPVLRMLTPQDTCRDLEIYPVRLTQDAISVDVSNSLLASKLTKGGSNTSLENNNVYGLEPKMYLAGSSEDAGGNTTAQVVTITVGVVAAVGVTAATYFFFFQ